MLLAVGGKAKLQLITICCEALERKGDADKVWAIIQVENDKFPAFRSTGFVARTIFFVLFFDINYWKQHHHDELIKLKKTALFSKPISLGTLRACEQKQSSDQSILSGNQPFPSSSSVSNFKMITGGYNKLADCESGQQFTQLDTSN